MRCASQATWHKLHTTYSSERAKNTTLASRRTRMRQGSWQASFSNFPTKISRPASKSFLHETSSRHMPCLFAARHRHGCLLLPWQVPGLHSRKAVLWCKLRVIIQGRRLQLVKHELGGLFEEENRNTFVFIRAVVIRLGLRFEVDFFFVVDE